MYRIKPAPERRVRQPDGTLLPAAGIVQQLSSYWRRRRDDGDVTVEPISEKPKPKTRQKRGER